MITSNLKVELLLKQNYLALLVIIIISLVLPRVAQAEAVEDIVVTAKSKGTLGGNQFDKVSEVLKKYSFLQDLTVTNVMYGNGYISADTILKGNNRGAQEKSWTIHIVSKNNGKATFIFLRPTTNFSFQEMYGSKPATKMLDRMTLKNTLFLYAANKVQISKGQLPPFSRQFINPLFDTTNYTLKLPNKTSFLGTIDLVNSPKVDNLLKFVGVNGTDVQIKGTITAFHDMKSLQLPSVSLKASLPPTKIQIGKTKSHIESKMVLTASIDKTTAKIGIGGETAFKIGQQTVQLDLLGELAQTVDAVKNPSLLPGFTVTMNLADNKPWKKAFGLKWLTIEDYKIRFGKQDEKIYGYVHGTTKATNKTVEVETEFSTVGLPLVGFPMPPKLKLIVNDGPTKVGSLSLRDFATLFNKMYKSEKNKNALNNAAMALIPDVSITGYEKGSGPIIDIDVANGKIEAQGKLVYLGKEMADIRRGTINTTDGVLIDADINTELPLGPVKLQNSSFKAVLAPKKKPLIEITGTNKDFLGVEREIKAVLNKNKLEINSLFNANDALNASYTMTYTGTKKKVEDMNFGISGTVTSDLSKWVKTTGVDQMQEWLDALNFDIALNKLQTAQDKVDNLQTQIDARRKKIEQGQANNDQALETAQDEVNKLQNQIDFLDERIDHFEARVIECNQYNPIRKTACKATRNQNVNWAKTKRRTVLISKGTAEGVLKAIQDGLAFIPAELDPQLASLISAKEVANQGLLIARKSIEGIDKLGDFTIKVIANLADINIFKINESTISGYVGKGGDEFDNPFELELNLELLGKPVKANIVYSPKQKEHLVRGAMFLATGSAILAIDKPTFPKALIPNAAMTKLENKFMELATIQNQHLKAVRQTNNSNKSSGKFYTHVMDKIVSRNQTLDEGLSDELEQYSDKVEAQRKDVEKIIANKTELLLSWIKLKEGEVYKITTQIGDKCLGNSGSSSTGEKIIASSCGNKSNGAPNPNQLYKAVKVKDLDIGGGNQKLMLFQLKNIGSNLCLSLATKSNNNGINIVQKQCKSGYTSMGKSQYWLEIPRSQESFSLHQHHSEKCMDLKGGNSTDGTQLQQWACNHQSNAMQFKAVQLSSEDVANSLKTDEEEAVETALSLMKLKSGSIYQIITKVSDKCIDNTGVNTIGAKAHAWTCDTASKSSTANKNQLYKVVKVKDLDVGNNQSFMLFQLKNMGNNLCLELDSTSKSNGISIVQKQCKSGYTLTGKKQYWIERPVDNQWFALRQHYSEKCMDLKGAGTSNGTKFQQWACGTTPVNAMKFRAREM